MLSNLNNTGGGDPGFQILVNLTPKAVFSPLHSSVVNYEAPAHFNTDLYSKTCGGIFVLFCFSILNFKCVFLGPMSWKVQ